MNRRRIGRPIPGLVTLPRGNGIQKNDRHRAMLEEIKTMPPHLRRLVMAHAAEVLDQTDDIRIAVEWLLARVKTEAAN